MTPTMIGEFIEQVTITQPTAGAVDPVGGEVTTWSDLATVWASVVPLAAGERMASSNAVTSAVSYRVTVWFRADLTPQMRIVRETGTLEVAAVLQDGRREFTVLDCREVVR
jgi:SPP1 family predicted phage head-tail adaptor